jgi:hypothetical protein
MRTVDHHRLAQIFGREPRADLGDVIGVVIGAGARPAPQNDVARLVAGRLKDCRYPLFGHRGKPVGRSRRDNGINGGLDVAVGAVLESHRHRKAGRQFPMDLALGCPRADCHP